MEREFLNTDGALGDDTLTPYDFAMEEVGMVSTSLARALWLVHSRKALCPRRSVPRHAASTRS